MEIIATIGMLLKVLMFFLNLWSEKDKRKAEKKAEIAKEVVDAFKETNKKKRASKLTMALNNIDRVR